MFLRETRSAAAILNRHGALRTGRLKIAAGLRDTQVLVAEPLNFRVKISLAGHDNYVADTGEEWRVGSHDDLVLAVAITLWVGEAGPRSHYYIYKGTAQQCSPIVEGRDDDGARPSTSWHSACTCGP